jgi:uncharacterized repeat protein (TIGR01451 family)
MRRAGLVLVVLVALVLGVTAPGAMAGTSGDATGYFVTIAARECPAYTDITANRARNDIQESLQDLGANTPYSAQQPISPSIEDANQPNCSPLPSWRFTLGKGYKTRAVAGPWGSLSIVTDPYDTDIVTQPSVPLLDSSGVPTGDSIAGAVTIELTKAQLDRAVKPNSLWIQGGTVSDPILNKLFPGEYGFGALRCAIDNLNGDNVEWISYPSGAEHVFCYAYYVKPPPTSGTIIIRKEARRPDSGPVTETFGFDGNISFNPGGNFNIALKNQTSAQAPAFYRASGETWTARELVPPGWVLTDLSCTKTGTSAITADRDAGRVSIALAPADKVVCTFTNALRPPEGQLFIRKITSGGTGIFDFDVFPEDGGDKKEARARTEQEDVAAEAEPSPLKVKPGVYRIEERLPESDAGRWRLDRAYCNAKLRKVKRLKRRGAAVGSVEVRIEDQRGATCTFENDFTPDGAIAIDKVTQGGTGTAGFTIQPRNDPQTSFEQSATTRKQDTPTRARGDSTSRIPLGKYVIQESEPAPLGERVWRLTEVLCDGQIVPSEEGRVVVRLTRADPKVRCEFVNLLSPKPPVPPIPPIPPIPPNPPNPSGGDLAITKTPDRPVAAIGERVGYTVVVRNRSSVPAESVVVADQPGRGERPIAARAIRRRCDVYGPNRPRPVFVCTVGNLAPGEARTYRFQLLVTSASGPRVDNIAAITSATSERTTRNNVSFSRVRVRSLACAPRIGIRPPRNAFAAC